MWKIARSAGGPFKKLEVTTTGRGGIVTTPLRRAGAFAALCTLSLAVPLFGPRVAAPVAAAVLLAAAAVTDGPVFELFAYPGDYEEGRLYGLLSFVLAAVALGALAVWSSLPVAAFVSAVLLVGYGNLTERLAARRIDEPAVLAGAFSAGGALAATAGAILSVELAGPATAHADLAFLAIAGTLLAALLRTVLIPQDVPVVMLSVGLFVWLLGALDPALVGEGLAAALAVTLLVGTASYAVGAASVAGMLTGILLVLLTIVFGGYDWFAVLLSFFAVGSLSTKFRYEEKLERGVAEDNEGARGGSNVLSNSAVALGAVIGYAATTAGLLAVDRSGLFLFAFAGAVATALSDTLSSEIGGVFDGPRLITSLERVEPGTDGAITWQGELAGLAGATTVACVAYVAFPSVGPAAAAVVVAAGVAGMTVDSLLGATLEGPILSNQGVNFLATLAGAAVCALLALAFQIV